MIPGAIRGANLVLGAPDGMENCAALRARIIDGTIVSAWMPTPDELARIAAGQPVFLHIHGGVHPPVSLTVPTDETSMWNGWVDRRVTVPMDDEVLAWCEERNRPYVTSRYDTRFRFWRAVGVGPYVP